MKIKFGNQYPEKGVWQVTLAFGKILEYREFGWRWARFGIFKLLEEPEEGVPVQSYDRKGFILEWYYWLPFERKW